MEEKLLKEIVNEIPYYIKKDFYKHVLSLDPKNEKEFQKQSLLFLAGALSSIKDSFEKFGLNIEIYSEKNIGRKERIDLLITVGRMRNWVELKLKPRQMSEFDHLLSQIERYAPYVDALVLISFFPLEPWIIEKLKNKEAEKGKIIRIVSLDKIV